jgi:hypothetical protein
VWQKINVAKIIKLVTPNFFFSFTFIKMDKYIKYNSTQGGPFTASQNLCDFHIPSDGVYNLRDSYITLNVKVDVTESSTTGGTGVYATNLRWASSGTDHPQYQNVALVKNCSMSCARRGTIESLRRVDILKQNLATITKNQRTRYDESYLAASQLIDPINGAQFGLNQDINKIGSVKSRELSIVPVQIKLSDLFDFCHTPEYDTTRAGQTRIHLELNVDKISAVQANLRNSWANADFKFMDDVTATSDNQEVKTLVVTQQVPSLQVSPFYVGQKLTFTGDNNGSAISATDAVISAIELNKSTNKMTLTFEQAITTLVTTGHVFNNIVADVTTFASASVEFSFAEIALKKVTSPMGMDEIDYSTFSTDESNGNGLQNYQRQFQLEAEAVNVLGMFPSEFDDLVSENNDVNSFRFRINNHDATDRDVSVNGPLYYDRLGMTIGNMGMRLRGLAQNAGAPNETTNWDSVYDKAGLNIRMMANPLPQTMNEKNLQVNITAGGAGVKKLVLYKELPRVFSY